MPRRSRSSRSKADSLFAAVTVKQAGRAAPETTIVDIQMMGISGRVFMVGKSGALRRAWDAVDRTLQRCTVCRHPQSDSDIAQRRFPVESS